MRGSHLLLVVAAEAAYQVARAAATGVAVGALDVAPNILEGILLEELLVGLQQLHVGRDDLAADVVEHLVRVRVRVRVRLGLGLGLGLG